MSVLIRSIRFRTMGMMLAFCLATAGVTAMATWLTKHCWQWTDPKGGCPSLAGNCTGSCQREKNPRGRCSSGVGGCNKAGTQVKGHVRKGECKRHAGGGCICHTKGDWIKTQLTSNC